VPGQDAAPLQPTEPPHTEVDDPAPFMGGTAMDRLAAAMPPRPSGALRAAWVATVLVLIGSAAAAVTWRDRVTRVWPASAWILGEAGQAIPGPVQPPHAEIPRRDVLPEKSHN
jgi:hypothetical protein